MTALSGPAVHAVFELLAYLTGTHEVSMMLTTPKMKVLHVTTHIGLIDAIDHRPDAARTATKAAWASCNRSATDGAVSLCAVAKGCCSGPLTGVSAKASIDTRLVPAGRTWARSPRPCRRLRFPRPNQRSRLMPARR